MAVQLAILIYLDVASTRAQGEPGCVASLTGQRANTSQRHRGLE